MIPKSFRQNVNKEIRVISVKDENYPSKLIEKLGSQAPEELHIWGNLDLLTKSSVGFCGSRDVSDKGLSITADVAEQISDLGWVVVSGHARGVDAVAHKTALENNAGTIIVLPQGFDDFKLRSELRPYAKYDNLLVISEFPKDTTWAVGRAMQRNKTIIGLSDVMVLVESRTKGGTFSAGKTALKYKQPLFVVHFEDTSQSNAGNDYFLQHGALRLMKNRVTNRANISTLQERVTNRKIQLSTPEQLTMPLNTD